MGWGIIKQGSLRQWPGYFLVALLTLVLFEILDLLALTFSAIAVGLLVLITLVSIYRWSDIVEKLGKWVRIWCGMIVPVTRRVPGVARQVARIVVLSARTVVLPESCTGSKTAPTRQHKA
jgi:hypothetical protein